MGCNASAVKDPLLKKLDEKQIEVFSLDIIYIAFVKQKETYKTQENQVRNRKIGSQIN